MNISEHRSQLENILEMEIKDIIPFTEEQTDKFKTLLNLDYPPHVFYNSTNIILTENTEYEKLKSLAKRLEDVLKIEMSQFNLYLFVGNYINCSEIKTIIGG